MRKAIRVLSRFLADIPRRWEVPKDGPAMTNIRRRTMQNSFNIIATRPSQRALPRFLRRSDRSGLRNPNYR
jgi:hypothetical protein